VPGEIDDRRRRRFRTARGSTIDIDGDRLAELLDRLLTGDRGRPATEIGTAHRQRTGTTQNLSSELVVRHPQRNRPLRIAEIHPQAWLHPTDDGQRPRPMPRNQVLGRLGHVTGQRPNQGRLADEHRRRHVAATSLCVQQSLHSVRVEGIGTDAVHRVGRQHDAFTAFNRCPRFVDGDGTLFGVVGRAVEDPECHAAILPVMSAGPR